RVGDHQLLSEAAVARTLTPASEMSMLGSEARFPTSFRGLEVFYGQMAVLHAPVDDDGAPGPVRIIGHSGSDGTIAWAWPDRDLMVLYFTQSRGGSTALRLEEVLDRLLIQPDAYGNDDVPAEFEPYLGTYVADWSNHMKEEFVVSVRGGKLSLDIPSQMVFELAPADEDGKWVFAVAPDALTLWFGHDEAGEVDRL
ncbi:MAG: penicillin-binding protein, partial [Anaerolineae bacterium]|nr:penicillin-binding protein [Anaerolineae bacterium]